MTAPLPKADAFDAFAPTYDDDFSHTTLGHWLRQRVYHHIQPHLPPPARLLELTCGTGLDALWFAQQGWHVTATDGSPAMVAATQQRATQHNLNNQINAFPLTWHQFLSPSPPLSPPYQTIFSNFGGLNTTNQWPALASRFAQSLAPHGLLILTPMGPLCFWETAWYLLHADWPRASRRWRPHTTAHIGNHTIPIYYPSLSQLTTALSPYFTHQATYSLGLLLPPSYLGHFVNRYPRLFHHLNQFEQKFAAWFRSWGDHYITIWQRRPHHPEIDNVIHHL